LLLGIRLGTRECFEDGIQLIDGAALVGVVGFCEGIAEGAKEGS
jgi:hypothetical protein